MQLSHYLKIYPQRDPPDHLLLYSTKKSSVILVKKKILDAVEEGTLSPSDRSLLSKLEIIVPNRTEEKQAVFSLLEELNRKNSTLNITVVLNLDCNFNCKYCYEGDMQGKYYMSEATADRLIEFVKDQFTPNKTSLLIDFYGGEPLLSTQLIEYIAKPLSAFVKSRQCSFNFRITTNGSLFTRQTAEKLIPLGLKNIKITLDGPAEIHNKNRPFKSGADSFNTIIENIKETCNLLPISLGGNFEKLNFEKFPLLIDYLLNEGLGPEKIAALKFDPVMKLSRQSSSITTFKGGCISINEPWIVKADMLLREAILKRGYYTPKPSPMVCMIENTNAYVVNFDGVFYKCPAFIGKPDFAVGDLQTGITDYTKPYKSGIWKNEKCTECEYLPLCFGGCRYMAFVQNGNISTIDCKKSYLDNVLETFIKQDIQYRSPKNK
ncbi:MAG: geopeptide radical SAM maturase [Desulfobacterales bacterium]|nr:geopeptide radical SAM maturase [Desulfobacterales bacterium]